MTRRQWTIIFGVNVIAALVILSPFLPGPSLLSSATNAIFSIIQLGSFIGLLLIPIGLIWAWKESRQENKKVLPIIFSTLPAVAFIVTMWGSDVARDLSRSLAIANAGELVKSIEYYKEKNGRYPTALTDLTPEIINKVPSPWIMGIAGYGYESKAETYELSFSQNVILGFNFEVVVYSPGGNHKAEGELKTVYDTGHDKWKYYIFD